VPLDNPWANYPGGNPFPAPKGRDARFMTSQVYGTMNYDTHNPNVAQWNLSIQRQLAADWLVSASVRHLNPAVYFPGGPCVLNGVTYNPCSTTGNTDARRRLSLENPQVGQFFGYVNQIDDGGTASYNGLLLSVQRRPNRGITLGANYTMRIRAPSTAAAETVVTRTRTTGDSIAATAPLPRPIVVICST
jgi:hypothetical protein